MTWRAALPAVAMAALTTGCAGWIATDAATGGSVAVRAVRGQMAITVPAEGELEATKASPIAVPRVPTGALKVKELAEEGTIVVPGDIVVVFDDSQLNIEFDNHKASFRSADRRIDRTGLQSTIEQGSISVMKRVSELERDNLREFGLVDGEIFSRQEILGDEVRLDTAQETIIFADASLLLRGEYYDIEERILDVEKQSVQGKLERVQYSLGNLVLKAPIGGLVVYKKNWRGASVSVGDSLWPGNIVMSIVDPASTALKAWVLERDAAGLAEGAEATVSIDAWPDRVFAGTVARVAELSRPIERGSPVKYSEVSIAIEGDQTALLKPGMKGRARILMGALDDVVAIPRSAVRGEADAPFVMIAGTGGAERREIELGPGDLVRVSVTRGLDGGESVLLGEVPETPDRAGAREGA